MSYKMFDSMRQCFLYFKKITHIYLCVKPVPYTMFKSKKLHLSENTTYIFYVYLKI